MKKLIISLLAALGMVSATLASADHKPALVGVVFYADWCGSCKTLDPNVEAAQAELGDAPVWFTRFDLTDDSTRQQSEYMAALTGLNAIYEQHASKTGFMLLIDPSTGSVVERFTKNDSSAEIARSIGAALRG